MVKSKAIEQFLAEEFPFQEAFGQKEEWTTRLKNILDEHHGDIDIFKEMIQNADDSGASEIHFICDKRTHGTDRVLNEKSRHIQGPSLTVYNNKNFELKDRLEKVLAEETKIIENLQQFTTNFDTVHTQH